MRQAGLLLVLVGSISLIAQTASADDGSFNKTSTTVIAQAGTVGSLIVGPAGQVGGSGSRNDNCSWQIASFAGTPTGNLQADLTGAIYRNHPTNGRRQVSIAKICDGTVTAYGWAYTTPTPAQLVDGVYSEVVRLLPQPTPDINPPGPGWVNLGMWLAVQPVEPVTVDNTIVGYSVRVTATPTTTSFQIDDQEPITCDGFGTPIVDMETVEQGPCGYTFRDTTPADQPATITVTTTWSIDYYTSTHGDGRYGELDQTATVPYEVREIQTVGTSG